MEKSEKRNSLDSIARWAMNEADGDWKSALRRGLSFLKRNPKIEHDCIRVALWDRIRYVAMLDRRDAWTFDNGNGAGDGASGEEDMSDSRRAALSLSAMTAVKSLYKYPLREGKKLGDARDADVEIEEEWSGHIARVNGIRARWFGMIRAKLPDKETTVREAMTEQELRDMQRIAVGRGGSGGGGKHEPAKPERKESRKEASMIA